MTTLVRTSILAVALLVCAASATQQQQQQGQYSGGGAEDPSGCSDVCLHYFQCKGLTDQAMYAECVSGCQATNPNPANAAEYVALPCDQAVKLVDDAVAAQGGGGGGGGGGATMETSCAGTVDIAGSWGSFSDTQMQEYTFYANGRVVYRLYNSVSGTMESAGQWSMSCPNATVTFADGTATFTLDARGISRDGTRWAKCDASGCF